MDNDIEYLFMGLLPEVHIVFYEESIEVCTVSHPGKEVWVPACICVYGMCLGQERRNEVGIVRSSSSLPNEI